jgi:hypothetical protein
VARRYRAFFERTPSTSAIEAVEASTLQYPDFVQRVPQYMLASLLGMTPEFLSRLRKKRSRRGRT